LYRIELFTRTPKGGHFEFLSQDVVKVGAFENPRAVREQSNRGCGRDSVFGAPYSLWHDHSESISVRHEALCAVLNERDRRLHMASEAKTLGRRGIAAVSRAAAARCRPCAGPARACAFWRWNWASSGTRSVARSWASYSGAEDIAV
jgi:hypothetical protein